MTISYNKLWKLLIDKRMNRRKLANQTGISDNTIAKMGKGQNINTDILVRVCEALDCDIADIMEIERN